MAEAPHGQTKKHAPKTFFNRCRFMRAPKQCHHMWAWHPQKLEESIRSLGTEVKGGRESPHGTEDKHRLPGRAASALDCLSHLSSPRFSLIVSGLTSVEVRGQLTSPSPPSTVWVLGKKLRVPGLAANTFTCPSVAPRCFVNGEDEDTYQPPSLLIKKGGFTG